ncbi:DUF881 domain-containing protein [Litorihabitans aurantiacus]|uniref:DUF881 domain-containing protein n=1 Tax=Litorihabitans aurantiacus TaxID=1930061 RepID=A0AA37XHC6_9MICO|nr:DUF881 domain-containing protein [Litorihabitans aurantiacus]GMA33104.1 hypothetical protein GCM10025875_30960 [Litorihabitans aurantiacus]
MRRSPIDRLLGRPSGLPGRRRPRSRASLTVALVAFVAGILFATSATLFAGFDDGRPRDLRSLVAQESERLAERNDAVDDLRSEVATLQASLDVDAGAAPTDPAVLLAVGQEDVRGAGVSVTLTDAPASSSSDNLDDLVVHQQDLQSVVNALWAGGAEAIAVQGQRIIATSAVRCVGNVLLLHGRTYSPPYVIEAVGDADALTDALDADAGVRLYRQYVEAYGLGYTLEADDALDLPAYTGARTLSYATAVEGTR